MSIVIDQNLALSLPLRELDGAAFASREAYGHACTVSGAGWRPHGYQFDGVDDRIVVAHHAIFGFGIGDFSLELWLRAASDGASIQRLISKQAAAWIFFRLVGGAPTLSIKDGTNERTVSGTLDLRDGVWHHLVVSVTRSSSQGLVLSVDGDVTATADATGVGSLSNTTDLQIGRFSGGAEYFKGDIGEVRVYGRALNSLEVQHNYMAGKWRYR